jgi:DNA polymerase-1
MPKSLYLIDGHSQIFRAYYAPFRPLTAPDGEPTKATYVFCQMLLNILRDRSPDYLAVAADVSDETVFRKQIDPQYKAHREPAPEDLPQQADRIFSILDTAKIPILRKEGYEADDIMATLVRRHANGGMHVYLVSRDKDLEQLLSDRVAMFDPMKDDVITPERLKEIKGWTPQQAIEAQILTGDSTDNVPGVPGIGPKTAAKLIEKYGSAVEVIRAADELTPRQRENVLAFAPNVETVRRLLTLDEHVPIDFELDRAACERFEWSAVRPIFEQLGFRRLLDQLPVQSRDGRGAEPQSDQSRDRQGAESRAAALSERVETHPAPDVRPLPAAERTSRGEYRLVQTQSAFERFVRDLERQPTFAVDTETTALSPIDAELVGLSFSWGCGQGVYVPVRSALGRVIPPGLLRERLGPLLADPKRMKVGHNIKFDMLVLHGAGLPVAGPLFDTMIAAFLLEPLQSSFRLEKLVAGAFGYRMTPIGDLIGRGRDPLQMDQIPLDTVAEYAGEDADYTWRLRELYEPRLKAAGVADLFFETEMPLVEVLAAMEHNGITLDADALSAMGRSMAERMDALREQVHALAGEAFNLDSPKQLSAVLFDEMGFRVVRRTKTARSTDAATLEALARETQHELPRRVLEYRELQKLASTYVDALPSYRSRRTGRIHTSYHQVGVVTGRLSSSEPNLQNIPVRTELGRQIRRAFVPRRAEERLIVADYSQIELRILAHFSQDEELLRAFNEDRDIHAFVAAQVNGVPLDTVTRDMRSRAKAVNFGIIYGQTAHGLAQSTGMSRSEAQEFISEYFRRYPKIRGFLDQCIEHARRHGYVTTILGRRRPIPQIDSRNRSLRAQAERLAINTVMQGSAADLIKVAMVRLHRSIRDQALPLRMLLQVHDELVCEGPADRAAELGEHIAEQMRTAMDLRVPLKVDVSIGRNWLEAK